MTSKNIKGKEWPWTIPQSSVEYLEERNWPKISIVTPSYNQGQFIEETILSVINQNYPNLEYIIIDGGSTDDTVDIIKKYEKYITYWVSEPDRGQSHAINKGFRIASGDIFGWINSDDYYNADIFARVVAMIACGSKTFLYGNARYYFEESNSFSNINVIEKRKKYHLTFDTGFIQPATFWTRSLWNDVGNLSTSYNYGFDWEWFMRACQATSPISLDITLATYRIHNTHKSGIGGKKRSEELLKILENYGFSEYACSISRMNTQMIRYAVGLSSNYRIGKPLYAALRLLNKNYWKYSLRELSELFVKAKGIYG